MMLDPTKCPAGSADYFLDYVDGWRDEQGFPYILPTDEAYLSHDGHAVTVGSPGVDGLIWAYRFDAPGIWTWYPFDKEWVKAAPDIHALQRDWASGALTV